MADPARQLRLARVVAALALLVAAGAVAVARYGLPRRRPAVVVRDLGAEVATLAPEAHRIIDRSETYYHSAKASAHVHVMGPRQRCPLHVHDAGDEAAVIVSGAAEVTQLAGVGPPPRLATHAEGWLVASPRGCAHEFVNASPRALLATLVFAAPPFAGNRYVTADDPRPRAAAAPFVWSPDDAFADPAGLGIVDSLGNLAVLDGRLASLVVRTELALPPEADGPQLIYVVRGQGDLVARGVHRLGPRMLATLAPGVAATVRAAPGSPIAALVFRPER